MADSPSIGELWHQAAGDRDRYRKLMIEHGYLVPCECACHQEPGRTGHCQACKPSPLPCGWPP